MPGKPLSRPLLVTHGLGRYWILDRAASRDEDFETYRPVPAVEARKLLLEWLRGPSGDDLRQLGADLLGLMWFPKRSTEIDVRVLEVLGRELDDAVGRVSILEEPALDMAPAGLHEAEEPAETESLPEEVTAKTWIDIRLIDEDDEPVSGIEYEIKLPDGTRRRGRTDADGRVRFDNIDPGSCRFTYLGLDEQAWRRA